MKIKTLEIPCSGYSIVADWYQGTTDDEVMLVLPGYTSTRERNKDLTLAIVKEAGMCALVIDYSGHGESPFELRNTRPAQHFLEVIYVFDWIRQYYPKARVSVLGTSYGGFLATQLTKYRKFNKLVLRVPAIYKPEAFYDLWAVRLDHEEEYQKLMDQYRTDAASLAKHPLLSRASKYEGKTLVVIHGEDEIVPEQTTTAFINAFNADSFTEPNFAHSVGDVINDTRVTAARLHNYEMKIADWLKKN